MPSEIVDPSYHTNDPDAELTEPIHLAEPVTEDGSLLHDSDPESAAKLSHDEADYDAATHEPITGGGTAMPIPATAETGKIDAQPHNAVGPVSPPAGSAPDSGNNNLAVAPLTAAPDALIPGAEPAGALTPKLAVENDGKSDLSLLELIEKELLGDLDRALSTIRQSSSAATSGTFMHAAADTLEKATARLKAATQREKGEDVEPVPEAGQTHPAATEPFAAPKNENPATQASS